MTFDRDGGVIWGHAMRFASLCGLMLFLMELTARERKDTGAVTILITATYAKGRSPNRKYRSDITVSYS